MAMGAATGAMTEAAESASVSSAKSAAVPAVAPGGDGGTGGESAGSTADAPEGSTACAGAGSTAAVRWVAARRFRCGGGEMARRKVARWRGPSHTDTSTDVMPRRESAAAPKLFRWEG